MWRDYHKISDISAPINFLKKVRRQKDTVLIVFCLYILLWNNQGGEMYHLLLVDGYNAMTCPNPLSVPISEKEKLDLDYSYIEKLYASLE